MPIPESHIPDSHRDIVDKPSFWHVATIGPDGEPQSNPVWVGSDDDGNLLFSCRSDRQKTKNLMANPAVSLSATDPDDPYRYLEIRGTAIRIDADPGGPYIDLMAKKYLDKEVWPHHDPVTDALRVVVVIRPEHMTTMG